MNSSKINNQNKGEFKVAHLFNVAAMGLEKFSAQYGKLLRTVGGENGTRIFEQFSGNKRILTCVDSSGNPIRRRITGSKYLSQKGVDGGNCHKFVFKQDYNLENGSNRIVAKDVDAGTVTARRYDGAGEVESLTLSKPYTDYPDLYVNGSYSLHNYNTNQHLNVSGDYSYMNIDAYTVKGGKRANFQLTDELSIPKGEFSLHRFNQNGKPVYEIFDQRNVKKKIEPNFADAIGNYFKNMLNEVGVNI